MWGVGAVFVVALAVWWIQSIAIPLAAGRDFGTYVGGYVELWQRHPIDLGYVLGRTPIAPLVTGGLLDIAGGALAEPAVSVLYALSIVAWFLTARAFGARAAVLVTVVLLAYPGYGILFHELASDSVFAAAYAGWWLLAVRAASRAHACLFALVGAGIAGLVLSGPGTRRCCCSPCSRSRSRSLGVCASRPPPRSRCQRWHCWDCGRRTTAFSTASTRWRPEAIRGCRSSASS